MRLVGTPTTVKGLTPALSKGEGGSLGIYSQINTFSNSQITFYFPSDSSKSPIVSHSYKRRGFDVGCCVAAPPFLASIIF